MLKGERMLINSLILEGYNILVYKRYVDDIYFMLRGRESNVLQAYKKIEEGLNNLDEAGKSIKVEGEFVLIEEKDQGKKLPFLDVEVTACLDREGRLSLETGVYRKPSAGNTYIHFASAHAEEAKRGLVRGELIRYLRLCSTKERFEEAWRQLRTNLEKRGYPSRWLRQSRGDLEWRNRTQVLKRLEEIRQTGGRQGKSNGIVVVVPSKKGWKEWWKACREVDGLTELNEEWIGQELKEMIGGGGVKLVGGSIPSIGSKMKTIIRRRREGKEGGGGAGKGEGQGARQRGVGGAGGGAGR